MRFCLCRSFAIYLPILAFSLIFTQALRSPLSGMLFVFMLLLPFACLVQLLLSPLFISARVESGAREALKLTPTDLKLELSNRGLLPYPYVEAVMLLPDKNAVRCVTRRVGAALLPFSKYELARSVTFLYRGCYEIGISSVFVYDMLRMFRLRLDLDALSEIFVLPRRLMLDGEAMRTPSDMSAETFANTIGADRSELSDIREYRVGDHMKTVHWQLSSKTQELVVREYAMNSGKTVYILADICAHYDILDTERYEDDINEYGVDRIIETCLAAAARELRGEGSVTLLWYDTRSRNGSSSPYVQRAVLRSDAELSRVYRTFATAPILPHTDTEHDVTQLLTHIEETQSSLLMFVTCVLDEELEERLRRSAELQLGGSTLSVMLCDVSKRVKEGATAQFIERRNAVSTQLEACGIEVLSSDALFDADL